MSCYHPLLAIDLGPKMEKDHWRGFNGVDGKHRTKTRFVFIENTEENRKLPNTVEIPCGKCIGCSLDYARKWANRCMAEAKYHDQNFFLTLTYRDECLPIGLKGNPTLDPDSISKFMKKLRKRFGDGIKFFSCGEYGGQTFRPHYHMILFGLNLQDCSEFFPCVVDGKEILIKKKGKTGQSLLYSQALQECWDNKGEIQIGDVSWDSCCYVARYMMKKQADSEEVYRLLGVEKPFVRMSRRPGIGYQFYQDHKDIIGLTDEIYLPGKDGAIRSGMSGYFKKLQTKDFDDNGELDYHFKTMENFRSSKVKNDSMVAFSGLGSIEEIRKNQFRTRIFCFDSCTSS